MKKYRIKGDMGYPGTDWENTIEAKNIEEANDQARIYALGTEKYFAEEISDEGFFNEVGNK